MKLGDIIRAGQEGIKMLAPEGGTEIVIAPDAPGVIVGVLDRKRYPLQYDVSFGELTGAEYAVSGDEIVLVPTEEIFALASEV